MSTEEDVLKLIFNGEDEDDFDEDICPEIEKQLLSDNNSIKDNDSDIYDKNDDTKVIGDQDNIGANEDHKEKEKGDKNETKLNEKSSNQNKFNRFNNKRKNSTILPNSKKFRPQRPFQSNRDIFPNFSQVLIYQFYTKFI